jgi:hypothetical protein
MNSKPSDPNRDEDEKAFHEWWASCGTRYPCPPLDVWLAALNWERGKKVNS